MRLILDFIKFLWLSKNEHRIHSPFVFKLYTEVICGKKQLIPTIEKQRKQLLKDSTLINTSNPGAGSKVHGQQHQVKKVAHGSLKSKGQVALLYRVVKHFNPTSILEIGTSFGITTSYLAQTGAKVTTLEGAEAIASRAREHFSNLQLKNIQLIEGDFSTTLPSFLDTQEKLDFVFFDGNHQYSPTMAYFNLCKAKAHEDTVFIFDDIYWSEEMKKAWQEIIADKDVHVSIDLFHLGLVFFKKGQRKEHFNLRFWP